jgi:hypothetical protein
MRSLKDVEAAADAFHGAFVAGGGDGGTITFDGGVTAEEAVDVAIKSQTSGQDRSEGGGDVSFSSGCGGGALDAAGAAEAAAGAAPPPPAPEWTLARRATGVLPPPPGLRAGDARLVKLESLLNAAEAGDRRGAPAASGCLQLGCGCGWTPAPPSAAAYATSWRSQTRTLLWRELLAVTRNPADVAGRMLTFAWVSLLVGAIFYALPGDLNSARPRLNLLFVNMAFFTLMPCAFVLPLLRPSAPFCRAAPPHLSCAPPPALLTAARPPLLHNRPNRQTSPCRCSPPIAHSTSPTSPRGARALALLAAAAAAGCWRRRISLFLRTRLNSASHRLYRPSAYYVAKIAATMPFNVLSALVFAFITYGMAGLRHDVGAAARSATLNTLLSLISIQVLHCAAVAAPNQDGAFMISIAWTALSMCARARGLRACRASRTLSLHCPPLSLLSGGAARPLQSPTLRPSI